MISKKIEELADMIVENSNKNQVDREIIVYGLKTGIEQITSVVTTIFLGSILGLVLESLVFFISFSTIRIYAGGYHTKQPTHCYVMSCGIIMLALLIIKLAPMKYALIVCVFLIIISVIIMIKLAPIQAINKPLDKEEQYHYRRKTLLYLGIEVILALGFYLFELYSFTLAIGLAIIFTGGLMVLQVLKF